MTAQVRAEKPQAFPANAPGTPELHIRAQPRRTRWRRNRREIPRRISQARL